MKKYITGFVLAALFLSANTALADAKFWHIQWNNGSDVLETLDLNGTTPAYEFLAKNISTGAPELWKTDTSLVWNDTLKQLEIGNISQDNIDLLVPHLALKASLVQVAFQMGLATSTMTNYMDNVNTNLQLQINALSSTTGSIQRVRAQTDTNGLYTWTYPTAYSTSTLPIIQVTVEDPTTGNVYNHRIVSRTATSTTIQLTKSTSVTILGISVLGLAANPQAFVHLTAMNP